MNRYARQLSLPEITPAHQEKLARTRILMIGAGGLGAAALPYLAGAGVGHITIMDHDTVDITNLHRQTIFKESDVGRNKAECAAEYLRALNSEIEIKSVPARLDNHHIEKYDLILDGSDNFETKSLLNEISIQTQTPLITAGVEGFKGMVGIFACHDKNAACYRCLHPEFPSDACNCAEAGILGTVAGLAGMYQAHLALCFVLGIGDAVPGVCLTFDFKNFRMNHMQVSKNPECGFCNKTLSLNPSPLRERESARSAQGEGEKIIPLVSKENLKNALIIDVRTYDEVATDPIPNALHIPLDEIPARYKDLPRDKNLAFACASNIRSRKAAEYLNALGYANICVLDRRAK